MKDAKNVPIRTLIVDDEPLARDELRYQLEEMSDIEVIGEAENGIEALKEIVATHPDLVFLDIQMPGLDGLEVARSLLRESYRPVIVFLTAYSEHAISAFQVHAIDYLLKPVEPDRLAEAIEKARHVQEREAAWRNLKKLLAIEERALQAGGASEGREKAPRYLRKISVKERDRILVLDTTEVLYIMIEDGIVFAVTPAGKFPTTFRSLDDIERELDPEVFWRTHRSYIANLNAIVEIIPLFSGNFEIHLGKEKTHTIPLSRAQGKRLRKRLKF
ncbi:MAG: response regulator [Deltaproteobacteria bacterium]|nr:MAG: response regulator [Deltaproteobacteria bacterium]